MCRFFIKNPTSNLFFVTSYLFGLTQVFETHHCRTTFLTWTEMPFVLFFLINNRHKSAFDWSIALRRKTTHVMFLTCTPSVFAIVLMEDSLWALTTAFKITCFVASLMSLFICFFSFRALLTLVNTFY